MAYERVSLEFVGDVAVLTLNHPETRNALSWALASEMSDALDNLGKARALVIAGAGKGFCSGGDMASGVPSGMGFGDMIRKGLVDAINPLLRKIAALKIPVVSAVNGAAAGAGAPLALHADFVVAGESAFFYFAFPNVGLALDAGASWIHMGPETGMPNVEVTELQANGNTGKIVAFTYGRSAFMLAPPVDLIAHGITQSDQRSRRRSGREGDRRGHQIHRRG